jgi:hypothetical protein
VSDFKRLDALVNVAVAVCGIGAGGLPVRRTGNFFVKITLGEGKGGEDDKLYIEKGFGGEEEMIRVSFAAILSGTEQTLRRAQAEITGRNDSVDIVAGHIR